MEYRLSADWEGLSQIAIYGFGKTAKGNLDHFIDEFHVAFIIDNDEKYRIGDFSYRGIPIKIYKDYLDLSSGEKIIIIAAGKALLSIKKSLMDTGKVEYVDFVDMDSFAIEWYIRFQNRLCLGKIATSVTTRCTFNCQNCNMLMPYFKEPHDYSLEVLKQDVDLLFSVADFMTAFIIIGGEPFLYPDLQEYVSYIGKNYGKRIGNIQLITNGSVLPEESLLKTLEDYNIEVRISDYTNVIPYKSRLGEVKDLLGKFGIRFVEFVQEEWIDFGFPHDKVNMGNDGRTLRRHMLNCHGMCHWLHDGNYYFCSNAWAAQESGLFALQKDQDYVSLKEACAGGVDILEFHMGNMKNGYSTFCKLCRGFASKKMVKAGVQVPRQFDGT